MPKSKVSRKHKAKVNSRNEIIKNEKNRMKKAQREFLEQLIKREQENGLFEDDQLADATTSTIDEEGPVI